ncbi:ABC-three component system protein [Tepidimonas charontis]|uniref:ABC-three component systems C-terminal domain-containing protein n=1 Tax=Tepidimonas charontis TaxID=2267262 RepID=A0A554X9I8_9BURK|nr:ABC-three component system protein [Tepidimonas charontis]TSE32488.1 hypothetical protein Tchar_02073 [Tepidimonas charontis]
MNPFASMAASRTVENYWARILFKLRLYEASGQAFQGLVSDLMHARHQDFLAVRPSGRSGDGGNDGYVPSQQWFLQVHGPEAGSKIDPARLVRKAKEDFDKLRQHYPGIKRYSFVFNDRFRGAPKDLLDAIAALARDTGVPCEGIFSRHLTDWFMALDDAARGGIVMGVPAEMPDWIDPRAIGEVLEHLALNDAGWGDPAKRFAPDFDEKIRFNGLNGFAADRLRSMSYQAGSVEAFFQTRDAYLAQAVGQELRQLYAEGLRQVVDDDEDAAAMRFVWMIGRMIPPVAQSNNIALKAYRQAAEVVLARYFETCDVYAQPGTGGRAA